MHCSDLIQHWSSRCHQLGRERVEVGVVVASDAFEKIRSQMVKWKMRGSKTICFFYSKRVSLNSVIVGGRDCSYVSFLHLSVTLSRGDLSLVR